MPNPTIIPTIVPTENYIAALSVEGDDNNKVTTIKPSNYGYKIAHTAKQNRQSVIITYEKDNDDEITLLMSNKRSNNLADNATNQTWPSTNASFSTTGKTTILVETVP